MMKGKTYTATDLLEKSGIEYTIGSDSDSEKSLKAFKNAVFSYIYTRVNDMIPNNKHNENHRKLHGPKI